MSRKIEVQILGDSKSLEAALGRAQQKTSRFGRGMQVASRVAGAALIGLGVAAKVGFDEINESQKVLAQTNAVLKSTGGAAGVTAKHVNTLAQTLLHLSGVDDETIASGENMLLTFRNIHNEAGRGNDIFDQATKRTLDLSVAMGKDMRSSAILVGKALNDPVKGMTALRRVGVQFTSDQEALIKKLVATGNTMEAQKLILGELNQEFGGSAKAAGQTLSGQLGKLRESFADVSAQVLSGLMPSLTSLVGVLAGVANWMKQNQTATKILVGTIAALSAGVLVVNAVYKVWGAVTKVVTAGQWLLNAALDANPVVLIAAAIIGLGIALVIAYKKSETFRKIVNAAFDAVKRAVDVVVNALRGPLASAFGIIKHVGGRVIDFIHDHWKLIATVIGGPVVGAILLVVTHLNTIRDKAGSVLGFFHDKWNTVSKAIRSTWNWIQNIIDKVSSLVTWIGKIDWPSPPGWLTSLVGTSGSDLVGKIPGVGGHAIIPGVGTGGGVTRSSGNVVIPVHIDGREVFRAVVSQDKVFRRQNGRGALA